MDKAVIDKFLVLMGDASDLLYDLHLVVTTSPGEYLLVPETDPKDWASKRKLWEEAARTFRISLEEDSTKPIEDVPTLTERKCYNCKHMHASDMAGAAVFTCRRYPPALSQNTFRADQWPSVGADDFCGEWGAL